MNLNAVWNKIAYELHFNDIYAKNELEATLNYEEIKLFLKCAHSVK